MTRSTSSAVLSLAALSLGILSSSTYAAERAVLKDRVAASQPVAFDVYLPVQNRVQLEKDLHDLNDASSAKYHKWLTPAQFNSRYAATPAQVNAIQSQLKSYGLQTSVMTAHRIHVTGSATSTEQALGTVLKQGTFSNGRTVVAAAQPMTKPAALLSTNAVITGLSGTVRMRTHSHPKVVPQSRTGITGGYFFDDLKQAYSFPSYKNYTGKGVTIGILSTGDFNQADMDAYFSEEKLTTPSYTTIPVDGGAPFDATASFETHLDLQQSGGMAPDAKVLLYNLPSLADNYIIDGLSQIVTDNKTDVVSMSFGAAEAFYTADYNSGEDQTNLLQEEDDLMAQGNAQGITFIASSGDSGALASFPASCFDPTATACGAVEAGAQFPASSPHVTGVGGTNLVTTFLGFLGDLSSIYVRENATAEPLVSDIFYGTTATGSYWGSGGGDSILFPKPLFQIFTDTGNANFRTVPDVALHMGGCPAGVLGTCNPEDSFDYMTIGGQYFGAIGTSAAAPDFAGLTALNIQRQGQRLGNENYYIYTLALLQNLGLPINVFKGNIPGFNGLYSTTPKGYNRVLGNGTLNGVNFLLAPFSTVAGTPQTPTNP
ncbi:S53 family peptidase [Granulicella arctica]|uniref:S53 family peptidase n=1 Tax=Granulicella arctica TaxID=940613 RepID=UPI0021DF534E|nr:S53 family peptidase [Granulicella arctica]